MAVKDWIPASARMTEQEARIFLPFPQGRCLSFPRKSLPVIPAKAGIYGSEGLGPRLRGDDGTRSGNFPVIPAKAAAYHSRDSRCLSFPRDRKSTRLHSRHV